MALKLKEVRKISFSLSNLLMTTNETILTFLINKINWNDKESVDYCFELAFRLDLSYMVDDLLDRLNEVKTRKETHSEVSW